MISTMRPRLLTLAAAALLAGCGADSGVTPTNTPPTLDEVFKEMSLPAISSASNAAAGVEGASLPLGTTVPTGCTYASTSQSFVCAPITTNGVTITQNYQLLNSAGTPLSLFDANALAGVRVQGTIAGSESNADGTFTLNGSQDQTLSGLQTSTHVLNGTSSFTLSATTGTGTSGTQPFTITMKTTTTALVIPSSTAANTYPTSGTIALDETEVLSGLPSITSHVVLTFNGTSKVKITVDGVALPGCSTIDLSSATPGCS